MDTNDGDRDKSLIAFCRLLMERFQFLTDLRKVTAQRHITLIAVVGAFVGGVYQFGGPEGHTWVNHLLHPAACILLVLGCCVTVYDSMMRYRASGATNAITAVASRISRSLDLEGMRGFQKATARWWGFRIFDEDFFFFSQILVINALPILAFFVEVRGGNAPAILVRPVAYLVYAATIVAYGLLWFGTRWVYSRWGPQDSWFPRAGDDEVPVPDRDGETSRGGEGRQLVTNPNGEMQDAKPVLRDKT